LNNAGKEADNLINEGREGESIIFFTPESVGSRLENLKNCLRLLDQQAKADFLAQSVEGKILFDSRNKPIKETDYSKQIDQDLIEETKENFRLLLIEERNQKLAKEVPRWTNYLVKGFLQGREYLHRQNNIETRKKIRFDFDWFKDFSCEDWQIAFNQWWFRRHTATMSLEQFFSAGEKINEKILETENEKLLELLMVITNDLEFAR